METKDKNAGVQVVVNEMLLTGQLTADAVPLNTVIDTPPKNERIVERIVVNGQIYRLGRKT